MIVGIFSSSFIGRMVDQYGYPKILMMNIFIVIAGALLTINSMLAVKILGIALFTFGFFGGHSVASGWVGRRALHNKAQASSLYLFFIMPVQVFAERSAGYSGLLFTGWVSSA